MAESPSDLIRPEADDALITQLSPAQVLALTAEGEARGQTIAGRVGVMNAVRNRVRANKPHWGGSDYKAVCLAREQFDCWTPAFGGEDYGFLLSLTRRLLNGDPLLHFPIFHECLYLAQGVIEDIVQDNTKFATHYFNPKTVQTPAWAVGRTPSVVIEDHAYYADVP